MALIGRVRTPGRSLIIGIPASILLGRPVEWISSNPAITLRLNKDNRTVTIEGSGVVSTTMTYRDVLTPVVAFEILIELGGGT
jgi:hypothetical protein